MGSRSPRSPVAVNKSRNACSHFSTSSHGSSCPHCTAQWPPVKVLLAVVNIGDRCCCRLKLLIPDEGPWDCQDRPCVFDVAPCPNRLQCVALTPSPSQSAECTVPSAGVWLWAHTQAVRLFRRLLRAVVRVSCVDSGLFEAFRANASGPRGDRHDDGKAYHAVRSPVCFFYCLYVWVCACGMAHQRAPAGCVPAPRFRLEATGQCITSSPISPTAARKAGTPFGRTAPNPQFCPCFSQTVTCVKSLHLPSLPPLFALFMATGVHSSTSF